MAPDMRLECVSPGIPLVYVKGIWGVGVTRDHVVERPRFVRCGANEDSEISLAGFEGNFDQGSLLDSILFLSFEILREKGDLELTRAYKIGHAGLLALSTSGGNI
jgi:hypothetical protein